MSHSNYWLECILCGHEFIYSGNIFHSHCPNCDLKNNRFGFCIVIENDVGKKQETWLAMSNAGLSKSIMFGG